MKNLFCRITALLLFCCLAMSTVCAENTVLPNIVLHLNGVSTRYAGDYFTLHPNVTVADDEYKYYSSTGEIITDLLLDSFPYDIFSVHNLSIDYSVIIDKGYCLDLSSSEIIRDAIERMYPAYTAACVRDGKIYAVPTHTQLNYTSFSTETLADTDFGDVTVPTTFPEFLDFVERWVEYLKDHPESNVALAGKRIWGDASFYHDYSYTQLLVENLLDGYIMQKEYAGESLNFNNDELIALLKRCSELGQALYQYDQGEKCVGSILEGVQSTVIDLKYHVMPMRINESQPALITATLDVCAVSAKTAYPDTCIELMEALVQNALPDFANYLYQDGEAILYNGHDDDIALQESWIQYDEQMLASGTLDEVDRREIEDDLEKRQQMLKELTEDEDAKYLVTPSQMAQYKETVQYAYVPMPGVFSNTEDRSTYYTLRKRYAQGQMTAEELVHELTRIAQMIEMENAE